VGLTKPHPDPRELNLSHFVPRSMHDLICLTSVQREQLNSDLLCTVYPGRFSVVLVTRGAIREILGAASTRFP
jgi:hypothetical protein